jgi:hypothetical protein
MNTFTHFSEKKTYMQNFHPRLLDNCDFQSYWHIISPRSRTIINRHYMHHKFFQWFYWNSVWKTFTRLRFTFHICKLNKPQETPLLILCTTLQSYFYTRRYSDSLQVGRTRDRSSGPGSGKIFLLSTSSRPTQPIQLVPGDKSGRYMKLTTHFQLVRMSRIRGSIHPLPHTSSWRST